MSDIKTYKNYIGGHWVSSSTGKTFKIINPADQKIVAYAQESGEADIQSAIENANIAFYQFNWRKSSTIRAKALFKFADQLSKNKENLAKLYTMDNGKTINEARGEISGCIEMIYYFAGMARNIFGRSIDPSEDSMSLVLREAIGTVGIISPWNWPVQLMLREAVPALAAGNAVVIKPASLTAAVSMEVIEILSQVEEIPKGIVNAVTGPGQVIGEIMANSNKIDMLSFTGDNSTGQSITKCAASSVKKITLELGGKSPNIIFDDANLEKAVLMAIKAAFTTSGQVCMAGSRLLVQESIFDKVVELMKKAAEKLIVKNGLDENADMGPLASKKQMENVINYIELGKSEGKMITGGYQLKGKEYDNGFFIAPTIFTGLGNNSKLVQEEIFGPVLVIQSFRDEQQAIELANGTKYGLVAAVWTSDVNRAIRVSKEIKAGTVWINTYFKLYNQTEFGGCKASGIGRTRGIEGLMEFTEIKHINFNFEEG